MNLNQQRFVRITAWTCAAGYVATIIVILTRCTPIHKTWQILPIPSGQPPPEAAAKLEELGANMDTDACSKNIPNYYALVVTNLT